MLTGTNLKYTKAYNSRIVLETIRLYQPLSRADIARRTELTPQTVSNITRKLMKMGLVREAHRLQEGRGAPATMLTLDPDGAFSIGLDFDKDHLTGVLVDLVGHVRQRIHHELDFPSPVEAVDLLVETVTSLIECEGVSRDRIWGAGVGLPGPLGVSEGSVVTNVVNPKAFPGWRDVPVVDLLGPRLSLPIYLENNATAAAVGERWYGAGRHIQTFFYVFFGAGLGGGLVINGQPYRGFTGNAGELGYLPTAAAPGPPSLFREPHLGVYFNLPRLYRLLEEHGRRVSRPSELAGLFDERFAPLVDWLETGVEHLAPVILGIEYLLDPQAIFFGGHLPDVVVRALVARLEEVLPMLRIEGKTAVPELRCATSGADAAALGVATLPMYASFAPAPRVLMKNSDGEVDGAYAPAPRSAFNA